MRHIPTSGAGAAEQVDRGQGEGSTGPPGSARDPEALAKLRFSGFRIDREGELQHEGAPVRHEGLRRALFRWLDQRPDGQVILRLDADRFATLDVDDTPLVARAARIDGESIFLALSDGMEERLDPSTLRVDDLGVMRCRVRGGRLEARVGTSAAAVIGGLIEDRPEGPVLMIGERILANLVPGPLRPES